LRFAARALSLLAAWQAVTCAVNAAAPLGARAPNIVFILADDLGYGDLGCYGQERIKTPHIDRMASEGMRLTDAYAGASVCAPSRCVLMTGIHVGRARVRGNTPATESRAALSADDETVAQVLKGAGYATGLIGKWGLGEPSHNRQGLPRRHGFDYFFGYLKHGHAHNYYTDYLWRNESQVALPNVISKDRALKQNVAVKKLVYSQDLMAEEALQFVRQHQNEPFFLYLALTLPHANNEAGDHGMEVPDYGQYTDLDWPDPEKGHAAMISRMDSDVGLLMAELKELGLDDNTLVIFTSDNGPHQEGGHRADFNDSNGPLRGYKGALTEGGIRVPFVARWPGRIMPGATSAAPVTFADLMPTFAALAGVEAPSGIDGADVSPTLLGDEQPELAERFLYWEFNRDGLQQQASRWGQWKAIRANPQRKAIQLYDLATDLGETQNVAGQHPEIVAKFTEFFRTARTDSDDWPVAVATTTAR